MDTLGNLALVGLGACFGTVGRYAASRLAWTVSGAKMPLGTLLVNLIGSFGIGVSMLLALRLGWPDSWLALVVYGLLGGLTTFSTLAFETMQLFNDRSPGLSALNLSAHLLFGVIAAWSGWTAGAWWISL
ncbi:MAG: CrcB family protein [Thermaerobacterales bacterium]